MSKHTPGPWIIKYETNIFGGENQERLVANAGGRTDNTLIDGGRSENIANACLIEAAPDLLAACEALQAEFDKHFRREYVEPWLVARMDDIDDAVARAKGE